MSDSLTQTLKKMLFPERHKQQDLFVADIFDCAVKDDSASMMYPIFTLAKNPDLRMIEYTMNGKKVQITPSVRGLPTIFDKDLLIFCSSLIMEKLNEHLNDNSKPIPAKTLRISCHDYLSTTNRSKSGRGYELFKKSLDRLSGVRIKTEIETNNRKIAEGFGVIDKWRIVESCRVKDRMVALEITLSDWFYNSILGLEMMTISRDYFKLKQPLARRIYEIARKFCGHQKNWDIGLDKLYDKTGSKAPKRKFRYFVNQISNADILPDYHIAIDNDKVTFTPRGKLKKLEDNELPFLKPDTFEKARKYAQGNDIYLLEAMWRDWARSQPDKPDSVDGAFIGWVKQHCSKD